MSLKLRPPVKEVLLKRTARSTRDQKRVEMMGRVAEKGQELVDAAAMLQLSYRKVKRMWRGYQQVAGGE